MEQKRKMPILYRYLLSFVLILSVPIVSFGLLVQGRFLRIFGDEVMLNNQNALNKTVAYTDWVQEQFDAIQQQISLNRNLRPFSLFGNATSALDCVHELSVIKNANDVIFNIAIYYKKDGRLYTGMGSFSPSAFLKTQVHFGGEADQEFAALLDGAESPMVLPAREALLNEGVYDRVAAFIYPIHYYDSKKPDATLVFFALESAFFQPAAEDGESEDHTAVTVVLDGERRPVLSSKTRDLPAFLESVRDAPAAGTYEMDVQGTRYLCASAVSPHSGWQFLSFTPVSYAMGKTVSLRREMFLYLFIIILLASAVIYWSMRLNYSPIRGLRDFAASVAEIDGEGNEFETVRSAVSRLYERNERLIQSTSAASREYILRGLLRGRFSREEFQRLAGSFHLEFPHACYVVLSAHIQAGQAGQAAEKWQELLAKSFTCYLIEGAAPSTAALIVNCGGGESEVLLDSLREIQDRIIADFDCGFSVGAGGVYGDIRDIPTSYMESLYALDYRFVKGNHSVIAVGEIETENQVIQNYPYHDLERLKYLLRLGEVDAIEKLLSSMLSYGKLGGIPLFVARRLCFDIIGIITVSISDMDVPLSSEKSWIALLSRFETIDELIEAVRNISHNICAAIKENKAQNIPLIDRLRSYARENCLNPAFSIQEMADHFDMGVTHLSQYFKNKSGQTILDYTTGLRMERARELLAQGNYRQSEIAGMVGYSSQTSFIRRFKQFYGQTPGQFAQKNGEREK